MSPSKPAPDSATRLRRFMSDRRGVSAIEFAILAPIILAACFAVFQIGQAIYVNRHITLAAGTVANLTSQYQSISASSQMPDILQAGMLSLYPLPTNGAAVTVSSISINGAKTATVAWSQSLNGSARATNSAISVPSALLVANTSLVLSEISYNYTPILDILNFTPKTLTATAYMSPRQSSSVTLTN